LSNTSRLALDVTGQQMDETFLRGSERFSELLARGDVAPARGRKSCATQSPGHVEADQGLRGQAPPSWLREQRLMRKSLLPLQPARPPNQDRLSK
jgi:hypothetical protein